MPEHHVVVIPRENEQRLRAWATSPRHGTFQDPLEPHADSWRTIGLALQTLAQEVLFLHAEIEQLKARGRR